MSSLSFTAYMIRYREPRYPMQQETSFTGGEWSQGRSGKLGSLFKEARIEDKQCIFVLWFLQGL